MKIFSNGCSFLGPRPKDGIETYTTKVIADAWNVPLIDSAAGGRGNDRICFTTKYNPKKEKTEGNSNKNNNKFLSKDEKTSNPSG